MKLTACLFVVCTTWSCSDNGEESGELKRMNVEKYFESPDFDNISQKVKIVNIFQPEFTDSSMLANPDILSICDGKAYLHERDGKWMTTFSYPDGKLIGAFNHYGVGPEEYLRNFYAFFTPTDSLWTVHNFDMSSTFELMQYDEDGVFKRKETIDSVWILCPMAHGNWLAMSKPFSITDGLHIFRDRIIYEYNRDWILENSIKLKNQRADIPLIWDDPINLFDGQNYITDNDTVYRYNPETKSLVPTIAIELGRYHYDWGGLTNIEDYSSARESYPDPKSPIFNDKYAWDYYYFGKNPIVAKFDMYNLKTGDLVYRRTITKTKENSVRPITEGFPITIDGQTVYGNILPFVKENHFFVCVPMDELMKIYDTDEINPVIVEIDIE